MNELPDRTPNLAFARPRARLGLILLIGLHIVTCCVSLIYVADFYAGYHVVMFDKTRFYAAAANIAPFAIVAAVFAFSRFSFGYFLGFYFYTVVLGYLWLVEFSKFHYDHTLASISAFASAVAFLVPALFITSPIRQRLILSARAFDNLLSLILIFAAAVVAAGAFHNFRLVGLDDMYSFRGDLEFPGWLRYALGATANALLPFAFACFVARKDRWRATIVLLLLLLLYPITLTKLTLFAPLWLLILTLISRLFEARYSVVFSLFLPLLAGVVLASLAKAGALPLAPFLTYFGAVNFRMNAFPSLTIDIYNDFFSTHEHTYFCQIYLLKPLVNCPYSEPLSVVMSKAYQLGNLNASLFATEGIASVGLVLAPLAVLACGLVISLGNRLSSGLPSRFILLSGGILTQNFLNVPLTTNLLTGGAAVVFLLWYVTPRAMFEGIDRGVSFADDRPATP
jgi:hypothetical protein